MANATRRILCDHCGREYTEYEVMRLFTGRTHYICKECYKEGYKQATQRSMDMIEAIRKEYRK